MSSSVPSLVQLCTRKALDTVFPSGFTGSDFEQLAGPLQRLLFEQLMIDNSRLRQTEKSWVLVQERCPEVDLEFYVAPFLPASDSLSGAVKPSNDEIINAMKNKEDIRGNERIQIMKQGESSTHLLPDYKWEALYFQRLWSYTTEPSKFSLQERAPYDWECSELMFNVSEMQFELAEFRIGRTALATRISSQLLLYRLIALFDLPPWPEWFNPNTYPWAVELKHEDETSSLSLCDDDGSARALFEGKSEASSKDGLELLTFLCGKRCMHPHGFVAGRRH